MCSKSQPLYKVAESHQLEHFSRSVKKPDNGQDRQN